MRFGSSDDVRGETGPVRQPPPNYSSRRVQYRLLVVVALVMTLLLSAEWLWNTHGPTAGPESNRLRESETLAGPSPLSFGHQHLIPGDVQEDTRQRAESDLWNSLLDELEEDEQQLMLRVLRMVRGQVIVPDRDKADWWELYQKLDRGWDEFQQASFLEITQNTSSLNEQQREIWLNVLEELEATWTRKLRQAMLAITEHDRLEPVHQETLQIMQRALDRAALSRVEDHTVFRSREHAAWYRIVELLQASDPAVLPTRTHGSVGGLQLMTQPDFYRGKLVRLRGTIRGAYRTKAPDNPVGLEQYTVLFIQPRDTDEPVVAFCLETPNRFPEIVLRGGGEETNGNPGPQMTYLNEDVEVSGFFFKSWVYLTEKSTISAPLLLVRSPHWEPPRQVEVKKTQHSSSTLLAILGFALFSAAAVVLLVSLRSRKPDAFKRESPAVDAVGASLTAIPADEIHPSTRESLGRMSEQPEADGDPVESEADDS